MWGGVKNNSKTYVTHIEQGTTPKLSKFCMPLGHTIKTHYKLWISILEHTQPYSNAHMHMQHFQLDLGQAAVQ